MVSVGWRWKWRAELGVAGARTGEVADGARRARHEHPAVDEDERGLRDRARAGCRDHLELHGALLHELDRAALRHRPH